jgi:pyridoxamine 5'-phosphate oxidase
MRDTTNPTAISELNPDPFQQFLAWYGDAVAAKIKNPDAMALATASSQGIPSARMVLYKGLNEKGLRFFTNYQSRKARELKANPRASVVFYWPALDRQVRVEGKIVVLAESESNVYWRSRARESQIGGVASKQSTVIAGRAELEERLEAIAQKYEGKEIPRPKNWGGYCIIPERFEFWHAGDFRIHDRFHYLKKNKQWRIEQLSP